MNDNKNAVLYIKYAELTLKGKNRFDFINRLVKNLKWALHDFHCQIKHSYDFIMIDQIEHDKLEEMLEILKQVPGIHSIHLSYTFGLDEWDNIIIFCINLAKSKLETENIKTFKIESRRQNKQYHLDSMQIKALLAGPILENTSLKVDVKKPDLTINLEVKDNKIIVFSNTYLGASGLPIGSSGRVLMLLSGGIDSPVASRLLMNRGLEVDFITFITPPHTSEKALEKVYDLSKKISLNGLLEKGRLYVCDFSHLQHELSHIEKESYRITLMRRCFFKLAKRLAIDNNYQAIGTGESLGQVASQTIQSMQTITDVLDDFLILRPLITYDKEEIIKKAKSYGTYELSILPYDDSCALFAPKNPVTKPNSKTALALEESLDLLDSLLDTTYNNYIKIKE